MVNISRIMVVNNFRIQVVNFTGLTNHLRPFMEGTPNLDVWYKRLDP